MNEDVKTRLLDSLDGIGEFIRSSADFAKDQAPLVVDELLLWGFFRAAAQACLGALLLAVGLFCIRLLWKRGKAWFDLDHPEKFVPTVIGAITGPIFGIICLVHGIGTAAYIKIAPRLYILDYAKELLNS